MVRLIRGRLSYDSQGHALELPGIIAVVEPSPLLQDAELDALVRAEQVRGLYSKGVLPFFTNIINGSVVAYVLWDRADHFWLLAWLGTLSAVTLVRIGLWLNYHRRAPGMVDAATWGRVFTVGTCLVGIIWGMGGALLYPQGDLGGQMLLLFVLAGMVAGATGLMATLPAAFRAFALPALAPIAVRLVIDGDKLHLAMAAMCALFGVAMSRVAEDGAKGLIVSERLRFRNAALANDLEGASLGLKKLNEELEGRVRERTAELVAKAVEQDRTTEALRRQNEILQAIFDHGPIMIAMYDANGRLELINRELEQRLGWTLEELREDDVPPEVCPDPGERRAFRDHILKGTEGWQDFVTRSRDGRVVQTTWAALRLSLGRVIGIGQDVTERRRAQEAVMLSERMASVGTLAAGVAHEINNPLAFVLSNQSFAVERIKHTLENLTNGGAPALREAVEALADAEQGAERVRRIVVDLKAFARFSPDPTRVVDIAPVLETCLRMTDNQVKHRAKVIRRFARAPAVRANEGRLGQVFLNLLVNAAQSIPDGAAGNNEVRVTMGTAADGRAVVEIADTGQGIPRDLLSRIFDPFFTTKQVGQGVGLGLSICHSIVAGLGGEIQVESEVGKGSAFRVLLPAAPSEALLSEDPPAMSPFRGRILIVDDEDMVGKAIYRMLRSEHDVEVETSVAAVLARLNAGQRFDVIVCDLMMPGATGMDLYDAVLRLDKDQAARMVFMTGGAFTQRAQEFLDNVENPRVGKPCDKGELLATLARIINPARAG
jgi:PAS domain S-box-containing protein